MSKKVAVILSGGMDSTTLAYAEKADGHEVHLISFDYGQRHSKELNFARKTAHVLGCELTVIPMQWFGEQAKGSALTNRDVSVPHGHYGADSMKATVVPNRNMVMIAIATSIAISKGCEEILYGAHPGDHAIYPDCRYEFVNALRIAVALCDWSEIELRAPFVEHQLDKAGIARLGNVLSVPWQNTWSCYEGGEHHCGNCGTCVERREALAAVGDPTIYAPTAKPLADLLAMK